MNDELEGMAVFAAVAESKTLRAAGERLGVSGSAVSQALTKLEQRLGVPLVQRTTRSLRLTEAGERLYETVGRAIADVRAAAAAVGELAEEARGTLRVLVQTAAQDFLSRERVAGFLAAHPRVDLDVFVSDEPLDIVAEGFDAGVRLGELIDRDMIAVPVSDELRLIAVGAPAYFARHGAPTHPRDLADHDCLNWHPTVHAPPARWRFEGHPSVPVRSRVLSNDPNFNLHLARSGAGITLAPETLVRDAVASGELVAVLEEFSAPFPGFYIYYPQKRHVSLALRAFIEYLRRSQRD